MNIIKVHFSLLNLCLLMFLSIFNIIYTEESQPQCTECTYNFTINKCEYSETTGDAQTLHNCSDYCRPHFYSGKCYNCNESFQTSSSSIYFISNEECKPNTQCNNIIIETNECIDEYSNNLMELSNQCKSKNDWKIIIDTIQGNKYYRCVNSCPLGFFDKNTNICSEKCKSPKNKIMPDNGCIDFCGTYNKKLYNSIDGEKYCIDVCPDSAPFYYNSEIPNKEIECLTKCNNQDFYNSTTKECISDCQYTSLIDLENNIFECKNISGKCPDSFPYEYKNSCLRYCSDTKNISIYQTTTYIFIEEGTEGEGQKKFCYEKNDCINKGSDKKFYIDKETMTCKNDCKETSNKYNFDNECIPACDKNHPYHLSDTLECVLQCQNGYYLSNQTCYKNCSESPNIYTDKENKVCLSNCKKPQNPEFLQYEEGYILKTSKTYNDITLYYIYCLKSCENYIEDNTDSSVEAKTFYHNNDDNICINNPEMSDCEDNPDSRYKYHIDNDANNNHICYKSCKDISDNYIYEYGFKCYNAVPSDINNKYYYEQSGIIKYSSQESENHKFCSDAGFYYLRGNKCVKDCEPNEYKILYKMDNEAFKLGECLTSCNQTFPYYSENDKICYEDCLYKKIKTIIPPTTTIEGEGGRILESEYYLAKSLEGNCVKKCPSDYSYESIDGNSCYDECPDKFYYITTDGIKKCVESCKSISKYYFDLEYECIDQCKKKENGKDVYYYFIEETNQCLYSCNTEDTNDETTDLINNKKFSFKANNNHEECLTECPEKYKYYYDNVNTV